MPHYLSLSDYEEILKRVHFRKPAAELRQLRDATCELLFPPGEWGFLLFVTALVPQKA